jgi:vitamin B12 transporter
MALAPTILPAQSDTLKTVELNEVVITATKFPKNAMETGKVLNIIHPEELDRAAGKDLSQILNEQVGIVVNGAHSNPGKDKSLYLRGAGPGNTLILVDGAPVNDPSGVGGVYDLRLLPLGQVERIEILKGGQSTLYGTDAVAGVVNLITRKGGPGTVRPFASLSYGSYNTTHAQAGVRGRSGRIGYHISYIYGGAEGISEAADSTNSAGFDKDGYDLHAVHTNLEINVTEKLSLNPFVRFTDFEGKYDAGQFFDSQTNSFQSQFLNPGLNGEYKLQKGGVHGLYSLTRTDRTFDDEYGTFRYEGYFHHGEVFWNHEFSKHYQILAGAAYQSFDMESSHGAQGSYFLSSPYASFFVSNLKRFSIELGGRFNIHSDYGQTFTWSFNPSYKIGTGMKLYFNYSTAFKAPTLSQLYGPFGANPDLQPESSRSLEGGLHYFSGSNLFDVRTTLFSRVIDEVITYTAGYMNMDRLDDWGIEVEPSLRWKKLTLTSHYAFVDGKYTTGSGQAQTENRLLRRPKHAMGLKMGVAFSDRFYGSLSYRNFGRRNDIYFDLNTFTSSDLVLDPYGLFDLYVQYSFLKNRLTFFADIRNLFGQQYYETYGYSAQGTNARTGARLAF